MGLRAMTASLGPAPVSSTRRPAAFPARRVFAPPATTVLSRAATPARVVFGACFLACLMLDPIEQALAVR
jgi:hypothetical protein